jgi:hypothetical protein
MNKLNVKALGLSIGIVWGGGMLLLGLMTLFSNWGIDLIILIGSVYIGYNSTLGGILIGTIWGFCDGAIFGLLIAWLYNKLCGID